jgi:hypothetical protein
MHYMLQANTMVRVLLWFLVLFLANALLVFPSANMLLSIDLLWDPPCEYFLLKSTLYVAISLVIFFN